MEQQKRNSKRRKKQKGKYIKRVMLGFIAVIIMAIPLYQSQIIQNLFSSNTNSLHKEESKEEKQITQQEIEVPAPSKELSEDEIIRKYITKMSLDEKIGQTIIIDVKTLNNRKTTAIFTSEQLKNIEKYHIGGVTFFGNDIQNEAQVKAYTSQLQKNSKIPLFMSVDEEGGNVSRLSNKSDIKVPVLPNMSEIGRTGDSKKAYSVGEQLGSTLYPLGFNLNFAPVSDVNTNPNNPVIGVRSFSSDKNIVAQMVSEEVKGMQSKNVSATLKHFPGHGDTIVDTHVGLATSEKTYEQLKQVELVPFQAGIDAGVDFVMLGHLNMQNITKDNRPATMSPIIIKDILRRDMKFSQIVITDSLQMGAIVNNYSAKEIGINCLSAGVDVILMPNDLEATVFGIKEGIRNGVYKESDLNESVYRILKTKIKRGIINIKELGSE